VTQPGSVLVTGASGFIGKATVTALGAAGWRVTAATRSRTSSGPGHVLLDLGDPASLLALAGGERFDAIVHLGARVGLGDSTMVESFAPNVMATGWLACLAAQWQARLVFASTAIVHGARTERIDADSPLVTDTAYAQSKWLAEQLVQASGAPHCTLRLAGVFGAAGPAHLGLNRAIDGAMRGETPVQVGSGRALRTYVYVEDVASTIAYALRTDLAGTHLVAASEASSIGGMLEDICRAFSVGDGPRVRDGIEASSQVVRASSSLPRTRTFVEAISDIRRRQLS
jgi:nucleoside-diphosphate-sugar epimerase